MIIVKDGESLIENRIDKKKNEFSLFNAKITIPRCPLCGGDIVHYRRTIHGEDPIFIYDCIECGSTIAYNVSSKEYCVTTGIDDIDIIEIFSTKNHRHHTGIRKDIELKRNTSDSYSDIMNANGLKTKDELIEFLVDYYRGANTKKETPCLMTIDDAKHYIQFGASNTITGEKFSYIVTITYQSDVYNTDTSTVNFECNSFEELKTLWEEYIEVNNIYPDCIIEFDIDISETDRNYINRLKGAMGRLLREIRTDLLCAPMPTTEEALDALLSSEPFRGVSDGIIFPHVKHFQVGPEPEDTVKGVKMYYR